MKRKQVLLMVLVVLLAVSVTTTLTIAQGPTGTGQPRAPRTALGTGFTYQGQLKIGGSAVNGTCDLQVGLWDDASVGTRQGVTQTVTANVANGLFTTVLNGGGEFGASAFDGTARWLAMTVRCPSGIGSYTPLAPRQALTPAPYALYSTNAGTATNATTATSFSGALGGDVTGTQSSTTVTKLQGRTVSSSAPSTSQVLGYNGSQWTPTNSNTLPGTIAGIYSWAGPGAALAPNAPTPVLFGPTVQVTTNATQRITGSGTGAMGLAAASNANVDYGLCIQSSGGGAIYFFAGVNYIAVQMTTTRSPYTAANSVVPGAGTWNVGFCVRNNAPVWINNTDWVNGWVMVTN